MDVKRVLVALVLAAVSLAAAVYLHSSYREVRTYDLSSLTSYGSAFVAPPVVEVPYRPAWADPAALLIALLGVGGGVGIIASGTLR